MSVQRVVLGRTGVDVSELCLGTMTFGNRVAENEADAIVGAAVDAGIDFVDTAAMYGDGLTEEVLGRVLGGRRDQVFLATKVHAGLDRRTVEDSLAASLARLRTEAVDLYLLHWPAVGMDVEASLEGLRSVVDKGMARFVGCCNYPAWLLAHANRLASEHGWPELVCHQVGYNLIERGVEVEVLPQAYAEGIAVTAYRPLCMGVLAAKYEPGEPLAPGSRAADPRVATWVSQYGAALDRFARYCADRQWAPADAAIAWVRSSPAVTAPIVGVSSVAQLESAVHGFDLELSAEEYEDITAIFAATEAWEEGLQRFPGVPYNYPRLRRVLEFLRPPDG